MNLVQGQIGEEGRDRAQLHDFEGRKEVGYFELKRYSVVDS